MLRFAEITPDNWRCGLAVREDQQRYVAPAVTIEARAWAYRKDNACLYLIKEDDTPVGMVLWYDLPEENMYVFSELFIDARYQGRGFGEQAARMALDAMKADGRFPAVILCYVAGNEGAKHLYEKLGFTPVDFDDGGGDPEEEPCMALQLKDWQGGK